MAKRCSCSRLQVFCVTCEYHFVFLHCALSPVRLFELPLYEICYTKLTFTCPKFMLLIPKNSDN